MRDIAVEVLTSFTSSQPLLVLVLLLLGSTTLIRTFIHKARILTEQFTAQIQGMKVELHEWGASLRKLKHELTTWRSGE